MIPDVMVWPLLESSLSCLKDAFSHHVDPPEIIRHHTGGGNEIAQIDQRTKFNECCAGLAWVRLAGFGPAGGPSLTPIATVNNCFESWGVQIELGAVRCWPSAGQFAQPEDWAQTAELVAEDAAALRRAVTCCFMPGDDEHQVVMGQWAPIGVTGQCVGGRLMVTVSSHTGDCCDDPEGAGGTAAR